MKPRVCPCIITGRTTRDSDLSGMKVWVSSSGLRAPTSKCAEAKEE